MIRLIGSFAFAFLIFAPTSAWAEQIDVSVKGMVCSFCAQGIKKSFEANPKVKSVEIDLDSKIVKIISPDGSKLTDEEIKQTISDAGYDVVQITRSEGV